MTFQAFAVFGFPPPWWVPWAIQDVWAPALLCLWLGADSTLSQQPDVTLSRELPSCLTVLLGHGCPVSLRYRWLRRPGQLLRAEASQGARACALGWHFGTGVGWRQGIAAVHILLLLRLPKREDQVREHL